VRSEWTFSNQRPPRWFLRSWVTSSCSAFI
jgi:hypothetical protein